MKNQQSGAVLWWWYKTLTVQSEYILALIINLNENVQSEHLFLCINSRTNFSSGTEVIRNTVASLLMFERCDKCCNYAVSWICQKLKFSLSLEKYVLGSSA